MTFKSILFCLFLYVCLAWVGAAYLYSGPKVTEIGLLWTGAGLLAVLALIILSRIWGWGRALRARSAARPKRTPTPAAPVNEDEAAIRALFAEANATLKKSPAFASKDDVDPLAALPLYLLVGPEGSGKTTTFLNSGLEPELLAGQVGIASARLPTRLCNLWLANNALFAEIGGNAFSGDLARWRQILQSFQAKPAGPAWRRFWKASQEGFQLQAVVAFCDVKEFTGASNVQTRERLDRQSSDWQDRLAAIAEVFGVQAPVHVLITKCDALPYLSDYFRRMPESETGQVLGCALNLSLADSAADANPAEAESKRLTKAFTALYHALAERRVLHLANEPDRSRRPAIYEFPRELKRIRPAVIQFLSTVFRPHPLRPNPELRGFYLSATGERQMMQRPADTGAQWSETSMEQEATVLFRADATQIFRPTDPKGPKSVAIPGLARRWMFVSELFQKVVPPTRPLHRIAAPNSRLERQRQMLCAAYCAICLLLCVGFVASWSGNRSLLRGFNEYTEPHIRGAVPTLADLQSLDELRTRANQLTRYEHDGAPLHLRWGLYSGSRIVEPARALYFRRFQDLLLNSLDGALVARLQSLPASPGPHDAYNPLFEALKTHLMISPSRCAPEPAFVSEQLKKILSEIAPSGAYPQWEPVARRQIDFYTSELPYGNPCRLPENAAVRDHARQYLAQIHGVERIYANVLASAEKTLSKPQRLADMSPNYAEVLSGPGEIRGAFSKDGWAYVERMSKTSNTGASSDACVLGESGAMGAGRKQDGEVAHGIQRLYVRDYLEAWRSFVVGIAVRGYAGPADAAHKLEVLSDHKSPLLALFALTSNQTDFPALALEPEVFERVKPVVKKWFPSIAGGAKPAGDPSAATAAAAAISGTTTEITRSFQPVHSIVPPGADTWVTEKNGAYVDSLAQLGHAMQDIARGGSNPDPALFQAAGQSYDKALDAARQIARTFEPLGVGGLDVAAERLLEAPIRQAQRFIISDPLGAEAAKINGQLHPVCARLRDTLRKFPFSPTGPDSSLEDVSALFAPGRGLVWKFQAESLGDFVVKEAGAWKSKDPSKKPQATQEMLTFLNRAQSLTDAFYPNGSSQPQFTYTLRPKLDASYRDATLELEIDGRVYAWTSSLQKQFTWSAVPAGGTTGVIGRIKTGALSFPFVSRGGIWGIFRVMDDAEARPLGSKLVEWKHVRGGDGRIEEIQPAPIRIEIVDFPGGADLFNPKFFQALQCPGKAVQ